VRIESRPGEGTSVYIYLPRTQSQIGAGPRPRIASASGPADGENILLVDDDADVREVTATTLRELGYTVHEAGSGGAALEALDRRPELDLILVDFAMPGMNGADLARRVRSIRPALPILFITGFADRTAMAGVSESQIIGKPFHAEELADKIRAALASMTEEGLSYSAE
jgi:CheY-like chemotaxis protein